MAIPVNNEFAISPHGLMVFPSDWYVTWQVFFSTEFDTYYKSEVKSFSGNQHFYHDTITYFAAQLC